MCMLILQIALRWRIEAEVISGKGKKLLVVVKLNLIEVDAHTIVINHFSGHSPVFLGVGWSNILCPDAFLFNHFLYLAGFLLQKLLSRILQKRITIIFAREPESDSSPTGSSACSGREHYHICQKQIYIAPYVESKSEAVSGTGLIVRQISFMLLNRQCRSRWLEYRALTSGLPCPSFATRRWRHCSYLSGTSARTRRKEKLRAGDLLFQSYALSLSYQSCSVAAFLIINLCFCTVGLHSDVVWTATLTNFVRCPCSCF